MTSTKYSISAAHRITGKSRTTISAHLKSGKLSFTEDDDGNKVIDASELIRVYGDACNFDIEKEEQSSTENVIDNSATSHLEIKYIKEQLEQERAERKRERETFQDQIDNLRTSLDKSQETAKKMTLLLEDKSEERGGADKWESTFKALENRISNQEKAAKEREEREQKLLDENRRIKQAYSKQRKALEEEKNKSFWNKLFG